MLLQRVMRYFYADQEIFHRIFTCFIVEAKTKLNNYNITCYIVVELTWN